MNLKNLFRWKKSTLPLPTSKIKLADNKPLTDAEYERVCKLCDIFTAIANAAGNELIAPPAGGVFWDKARPGMGPFELHVRKDRKEINHLFLLFNAFRDFCALAYEYDEHTPTPDYWIRRYVRLANAVPEQWRVRLPARFGELGWNVDGYPVNRWSSVNQERICAMMLAGIPQYLQREATPRILELGGGSGEMGYVLCNALPNCTWYDADLLGCLIYSAIQMAVNLPQKKHYIYVGNLSLPDTLDESYLLRSAEVASQCRNAIVNIPHFLLDDFKGHLKLQFAYNTYSLGEMPTSAVTHYSALLADFLKQDGIFFEQNGYFPNRGGDNAEEVIATQFKRVPWGQKLDGQWFPNGPIRFWTNNDRSDDILSLVKDADTKAIVDAIQDRGDKVDIRYPNERMWESVYQLFTPNQIVEELFPW